MDKPFGQPCCQQQAIACLWTGITGHLEAFEHPLQSILLSYLCVKYWSVTRIPIVYFSIKNGKRKACNPHRTSFLIGLTCAAGVGVGVNIWPGKKKKKTRKWYQPSCLTFEKTNKHFVQFVCSFKNVKLSPFILQQNSVSHISGQQEA